MSGVYTIPAGESFVGALARTLLAEAASDPLKLAEYLILLPNRRAARSLREAFLAEAGGKPLLLPRMRPIGEADEEELELEWEEAPELPPAIPPLRRRLLLARLIVARGEADKDPVSWEQATALAEALARLLDQVATEELAFDRLAELVPAEYAEHWQKTLKFLTIVTEAWPAILAAEGFIEPARRRNLLLDAQAQRWRDQAPAFPVIAAGSTGSLPATVRLLAVVAALPTGRVVLPGLDQGLDEPSRAAMDQTHPQHLMLALLRALEIEPAEVLPWPDTAEHPRARLVSEAMRPASTTDRWRETATEAADLVSLAGLERIDAPGEREEAGAIALLLRSVLEKDGLRAALVTPDRDLARRVAAELGRYGVAVDDSAGRPLALTPPGAFLLLTAEMVAEGFAPLPTLAALKHPLAVGGMAPGHYRRFVRDLERAALRGVRPAPGVTGLQQAALRWKDTTLDAWLIGLELLARPLAEAMAADTTPIALLRAHLGFAEALSVGAGGGLWAGEAGEAASRFMAELIEAIEGLPAIPGLAWPGLLRGLMEGVVVRPSWGGHPRLAIWGPLEARLQQVDLLVLGGLNEGTWPPVTAADPWMSRPMRTGFGLPPPERRIGLSAHDFAQGLCAPRVVITRARRSGGAPTVPSRWLLRLDAVRAAAGLPAAWPQGHWLAWHQALDAPTAPPPPAAPPAPTPPVALRPRSLYVTDVEMWRRDPYGLYAKHILRLRPLDPLDASPDAADFGNLLHGAFADFLRTHPVGDLPSDALAELIAHGRRHLEQNAGARPAIRAFWEPRFIRAAAWFVEHEQSRRGGLFAHSEIKGQLPLSGPAGPFILQARADRVDRAGGHLVVVDYKTGTPPRAAEVLDGYAPQLPLEAAIAQAGGFPDVPGVPVGALEFWRFGGGREAGSVQPAGGTKADPIALANDALAGLERMVAAFDNEATPYRARPHPDYAPAYSDYGHLARVPEWQNDEGGGG